MLMGKPEKTYGTGESLGKCGSVHSLHIYDSDKDLVQRLCAIVSSSLRIGDAVLIVGTPEHRDDLVCNLRETGLDLRECVRQGRYTMLDARDALSTFMQDGLPDRKRFFAAMGSTVEAVRSRARSGNGGITVFGEMVAILWNAGNQKGALELEMLWNEAISRRAFHLHCAYPRQLFRNENELFAVHATHTHVANWPAQETDPCTAA